MDLGLLESKGWFSARKVAFENGHFVTAPKPLIVEITLYGEIIGPLRLGEYGNGFIGP